MWLNSSFDIVSLAFPAVAILLYPLYVLVTVTLEALVLKFLMRLSWHDGILFSYLANFASGLVSAIWYVAGLFEGGWKTSMMKGEFGRALLLMLRSYLVTLCVEVFVLVFCLSKTRDARLILKVTAAANGVSYIVAFGFLAAISPLAVQNAVNP